MFWRQVFLKNMKILDLHYQDSVSEILALGELCHNQDGGNVLSLLVEKIAQVMQTDVCSLYLLDPASQMLTLVATRGLNSTAVGRVQMGIGEGLVGKAFEWQKPVSLARGTKSKRFKYFPETGEEQYASFLAIPLIDKRKSLGVLVVQNRKATRFSARSAGLLMMLALPSIQVIEKIKLSDTIGQVDSNLKPQSNVSPITLVARRRQGVMHHGIGAAPGIAIARVKIIHKNPPPSALPKDEGVFELETEKQKVLASFATVEAEVRTTQAKAEKQFGAEEAAIFDAYRMILESDVFKNQVLEEIEKGKSALKSLELVIQRYTEELSLADDNYIRERAYDIRDMGRKLTDNLLYGAVSPHVPVPLEEPTILLSEFWSISDFVDMDLQKVKGILSPSGGASSHIAILAESQGLPAVLGLASFTELIRDGDLVIMDGSSGAVIINPDDRTLETYELESQIDIQAQATYRQQSSRKVGPIGGKKVAVGVNLGMLAHVRTALENGAEEIGLYRTEFPFLIRRSLPTEEEQFELYKKVVESMHGKPVAIRTLDIGGDKYLPYLNLPQEANPFLGWRSIRISLDREDLFRIQLRAILRAAHYGKVKLLFPMISSIDEIRRVKQIVKDVKRELKTEKNLQVPEVPLGMMIEIPAAVELAHHFIKEVSFFSIGTNDLTQYVLAVDRNNSKVASLYNSLHPAVLRQIAKTTAAAHREKKPVSVCGEMAGQMLGIPILLGLSIDSLSMSAPLISKAKSFMSRLKQTDVKKLAKQVLEMESATEVTLAVEKFIHKAGLSEFLRHHEEG